MLVGHNCIFRRTDEQSMLALQDNFHKTFTAAKVALAICGTGSEF